MQIICNSCQNHEGTSVRHVLEEIGTALMVQCQFVLYSAQDRAMSHRGRPLLLGSQQGSLRQAQQTR